jgi:type VI secretion system protein ImpA
VRGVCRRAPDGTVFEMAPLDTGAWLDDISAETPTGPNLEFDPDFAALEQAAQGKPEQQYGTTIIPAEDPDWKAVEAQAAGLLERTRDLRVLCHLAVARLHLAGLTEFAAALGVIRQLLETRWEQIHPQLDPDDDNDPTLRGNALLRLGQQGLVLRHIRNLPLANSPRLGAYSWRDIALATGAIEAEANKEKPSEGVIRSAFQDSDPAALAALREAALAAAAEAAAIPAVFEAKAGFGTGPDFTDLVKLLREVARDIGRYAVLSATPETAEAAAAESDMAPQAAAPASGMASLAALTTITTRAEALRLLDLVCQYYERYEPSSPLPLLIDRARRLAEKNFLDILRDLAPDGVNQAQNIVGTRDE